MHRIRTKHTSSAPADEINPTFAQFGAKYLARGGQTIAIPGSAEPPKRTMPHRPASRGEFQLHLIFLPWACGHYIGAAQTKEERALTAGACAPLQRSKIDSGGAG